MVTVVRHGTFDAYGDPATTPTRVPVPAARFAPGPNREVRDRGREGVVATAKIYLPAGTTLAPTDTVDVDGVEWRIDGVANTWQGAYSGGAYGAEVSLWRADG